MELSKRLKFIADKMDKCSSIGDIGTDHGYIPIYAVKNGICNSAIASDIHMGPVKKAKDNIRYEGLSDKIKVRHGAGLVPYVKGEVEAVIIAGMGGHLICDILNEDISKIKKMKYLILQPAQNPEVLRKYLYNNNFEIIQEDICIDEGIFYELFKVKWDEKTLPSELEEIYYEISPRLLKTKNNILKEYIVSKKDKCNKILKFINEDTDAANKRKREMQLKISYFEKFLEEYND